MGGRSRPILVNEPPWAGRLRLPRNEYGRRGSGRDRNRGGVRVPIRVVPPRAEDGRASVERCTHAVHLGTDVCSAPEKCCECSDGQHASRMPPPCACGAYGQREPWVEESRHGVVHEVRACWCPVVVPKIRVRDGYVQPCQAGHQPMTGRWERGTDLAWTRCGLQAFQLATKTPVRARTARPRPDSDTDHSHDNPPRLARPRLPQPAP